MMSPIPAFELSFWNAWIFPLYLLSYSAVVRLIDNRVWEKMQPIADRRLSKTEKKMLYLSRATRLFLLVYSFFLPLRVGTVWCYVGIPICVIGSTAWTFAWVSFATTPLDEPVTKGLYRYSRHPMFLAAFLVSLGVSVASASWLYLLFAVVGIILRFFLYAIPEESFCLAKYGDAYREYLNRTPRWIGIPKPKKFN